MANIYEQELGIFQRKYNLEKYSLDEIQTIDDKFRLVNDPLTKPSISGSPAAKFTSWASTTLSIYLKTNTQLNEKGKYMSSFDVQEFLTDFESLVVAKYNSELVDGQEPNRKPYAGASKKDLLTAFHKQTSKMNKTLPTLWMEKLKKGDMDMQSLQNITSQAFDAMDKTWQVSENEMAGKLTNMVAAREAMKQLRASRSGVWGWIWKVILNRGQNRQEKAYLAQLETQIMKLRDKGYKVVDKLTEELTGTTVLGQDPNAKKNATKTQDKEVKQAQESPATSPKASVESKVKSTQMKPVADQIEDTFSDMVSETVVELYRETSGDKPSANETEQEKENREQRESNRSYAYKFLLQGMKDTITELNQQFDEAVANGGNPKKEMQKVVNGIFQSTVERFSMNVVDGKLEKVEAFKNATQIIVNNFTAAAIYPNELKEAVNAYINQNVEIYKEIVEAGKEYSKEIGNYKQQLEQDVLDGKREPVFDDEHPFVEDSGKIASQVSGQPKQNVTTLNNGNK